MNNTMTIMGGRKTKNALERTMKGVFIVCGAFAVVAVLVITVYMIISGAPAMFTIGFKDFLFGTQWAPTASDPKFGILPMILTSLVGTGITILIGVPIALMAAVFVSEVAPVKLAGVVKPAIELLAGIPSVVYGLLGMILLVPQISKLETLLYANDPAHTFTGGANMLSGIIVLTIMILPTVVNISITSLRVVPREYMEASLATGATKMQTIFKVQIPAAKSGIITGIVLGIGRALGEAMAIILVSGNVVNMPGLFNSVRFLTTGIVSEMSYASGLHREALFSIGLVLFVFIMIINVLLNTMLKKGGGG
ncbi:phosphate transport system permease protein [Christensenellaceae bacterium]|nr:phosphate transport system permease protein [Christensenellaceae bacterium]BDF61228.1 phosphate transport system permease protein [Christensenellaceae bacterium]